MNDKQKKARRDFIDACLRAIMHVNNDTTFKGIDKDLFEASSVLEQKIETINE